MSDLHNGMNHHEMNDMKNLHMADSVREGDEYHHTNKYGDIDDDLSLDPAITGLEQSEGAMGMDGVFVPASHTGHIDLDQLHSHDQVLHTAMYVDLEEIEAIEHEYADMEYADSKDHIPFSHTNAHHSHIVDITGMTGILDIDIDMSGMQGIGIHDDPLHDHYDFHHDHGEHHNHETASKLLLKGIDIAQKQNHEGLVKLYRGQVMCLNGKYDDAIIQLEKCLEYFRHLHLSDFGDSDSDIGSKGSCSSTGSKNKMNRKKCDSKYTDTDDGIDDQVVDEHNTLDLTPHIYGILIEAYYATNQYHRANSVAREWLEKYPKNISPYQALAWCLIEQNQTQDAINLCTNCIKKLPESEGMMIIYSIRGKCYLKIEKYEEACKDFGYIKEMENKNLARFAPEKVTFFTVNAAGRLIFPKIISLARPDISSGLRNPFKYDIDTLKKERETAAAGESKKNFIRINKSGNVRVNVNEVRNYVPNNNIKRFCAKCSPGVADRRDPNTRKSVTVMKMGRTTDSRRGSSPSRLILNTNPGKIY